MDSVFDKPDLTIRENPFFLALQTQKQERDRYKQILQLALMNAPENVDESQDETP
jgi:hypothetical protein